MHNKIISCYTIQRVPASEAGSSVWVVFVVSLENIQFISIGKTVMSSVGQLLTMGKKLTGLI